MSDWKQLGETKFKTDNGEVCIEYDGTEVWLPNRDTLEDIFGDLSSTFQVKDVIDEGLLDFQEAVVVARFFCESPDFDAKMESEAPFSGVKFEDAGENLERSKEVKMAKTNNIYIHDANPRMKRDEEEIKELADSIVANGFEYPIKVVEEARNNKKYGCFDGGYRLEATKRAGIEKIPILVEEGTSENLLEKSIVADEKRVDLNPIEKGKAFKRLLDSEKYNSINSLSEHLPFHRETIRRYVNLMDLSSSLKDMVAEKKISVTDAQKITKESKGVQEKLTELLGSSFSSAKLFRKLKEAKRGKKEKNDNMSTKNTKRRGKSERKDSTKTKTVEVDFTSSFYEKVKRKAGDKSISQFVRNLVKNYLERIEE